MWSEKHLHQLAYYPTTLYWDTVWSVIKKMARAMAALKVAKIVVNGTEPDARLLYRLMAMLGGQAVPPIEEWPSLSGADELLKTGGAEVGYESVVGCGDELGSKASGCSSGETNR